MVRSISHQIDAQFFGGPLDGRDIWVPDPAPRFWSSQDGGRNHLYTLDRIMKMADECTRVAIYRYRDSRAESGTT